MALNMDFDNLDFSRQDLLDGIDNEALDLFMQVAAGVCPLDNENENNQTGGHGHNLSNVDHLGGGAGVGGGGGSGGATKLESPHTPPMQVGSLSSTPISTPHTQLQQQHTHSHNHLPESPPDSGSEPAYSPLGETHGLTLPGRELIYPMLQTELQYPSPPHPHPHQHPHQHQHLQQMVPNSHQFVAPPADVRIKHESGLIMNPNSLMCQQQQQQQQQSLQPLNEQQLPALHQQQHHELPQDQMLYQHFDNGPGPGSGLYSAGSYQNLSTTCMLTSSLGLGDRVQVIGTSQLSLNRLSAPSTPVHSSSRKRKMSTQLDCQDFAPTAKLDTTGGLVMSPLRASHHSLATTPQDTNLSKTPAHSHCSASVSPALSGINSHADNSLDGQASNAAAGSGSGSGSGSEAGDPALSQCIRFSPFQPENWHKLCDQSLQELSVIYYRVDADKGFNFSVSDDAYVCQKKNHFQVTCHARLQGDAKFVKTPSGLEKIKSFHLHFYGVKFEAPNQTIRVEQSQSDRSKKPFYPVPIDLQSHIVSKITVGRLHFSETTNNNMRKKGRPNPEQRFFQLVVGLHVHTTSGNFPVVSHGSERIIVRASNPGQFESDVDLCWQRGLTQESIFHAGRVGINTDRPDESLVVHGNLKVSGHIVQPSDSRAKQEIGELDTSVQLRNLQKIRIVRYRYEPEFAVHSGLRRESDTREIVDTGVIAQEVREVIPDAVQEAGSVVLPNGNVIENFLLVNKDRILMENIGAVKELCKVTGSLETRIEHLERANSHQNSQQLRAKDLLDPTCLLVNGAIKSSPTGSSIHSRRRDGYELCSSRSLQIVIFLLIIVMAACLAAVSTLYFVEHNKQQQLDGYQLFGNGHLFRSDSTSATHLSDEDRQYFQHNLHTLFKNKTHVAWPSLMYATSTSRPPPAVHPGEDDTEELAAVMTKPQVQQQQQQQQQLQQQQSLPNLGKHSRITTTAPRVSNKTISTKNGKKWPLPQEVLRQSANGQKLIQSIRVPGRLSTLAGGSGPSNENSTLVSSEKPPEVIALAQDFENNSIDIDAQQQQQLQQQQQQQQLQGKTSSLPLPLPLPTLKLDEHIVVVGTIASSSTAPDPSAGQAIRKLNTGDAVIYNVYKTVSPPTSNLALTTNKVSTEPAQSTLALALDVPPPAQPVRNSSGGHDNVDALDLQNLSNTNESVDNPITALFGFEFTGAGLRDSSVGRRSANQRSLDWIRQKSLKTPVFGQPKECNGDESVSDNCQSVCYEESPSAQSQSDNVDANVKQQHVEDLDLQSAEQEQDTDIMGEQQPASALPSGHNETETQLNSQRVYHGKSSHNTDAQSKQFSTETDTSTGEDALYSVVGGPQPPPGAAAEVDHVELLGQKSDVDSDESPSIAMAPIVQLDCWSISTCVLAAQSNYTIDVDQFCPTAGSSWNISYMVPVSRYLQATNLELHFNSNKPLQWSICTDEDQSKAKTSTQLNEDDEAPPSSWVKVLKQMGNNKLILALDIPTRGNFVRDFMLRASHDLEQQKLCDDNAHVANPILQYNFSIVRDCD